MENVFNIEVDNIIKSIQIGCDTTFELNEFGEPRMRSELETVKNILLFILFTKPGQYPSLPTLGYDIGSKLYSFYDDIREDDIIEDVCSQCEALRPYFNNGQIALKKDKYNDQPSMLISISGSESFPAGYRNASRNNNSRYMIGITYDDLHKMIYDVKQQRIQ